MPSMEEASYSLQMAALLAKGATEAEIATARRDLSIAHARTAYVCGRIDVYELENRLHELYELPEAMRSLLHLEALP